jgi:hypothetical protein
MHVTRTLVTGGLGTAAVLLAVAAPASAATSAPTAPSASPTPISEPGWAGYYTNNVETQASTTFVVPKIDCSANPAGSFAGQALGVQFLSNYNGTTGFGHGPNSVVRVYCIGSTAHYDAEFYFENAADTNEVAVPAGVSVQPGDLILVSVQVTASQSVDTLVNISHLRDGVARQTGPGSSDAGPDVGLAALSGDASGPIELGSPAASSPPAPSAPVRFFASLIGLKPLSGAAGLGAQEWTNPSDASEVWAAPSALTGDSFTVTVTP